MSNISIPEFKARNAEAQRINSEIQKAYGARDEHKKRFEQLCTDYEATYGEKITAENLGDVYNRVASEVEAQRQAQIEAIERAKAGIVIPKVSPTDTATSTESAPAPAVQAPVAPIAPAVQPNVQAPVAPVAPPVVPQITPQPIPAAPTAAFGAPLNAPTVAEEETPSAKPISAAALSAAALAQSNTQPNLSQPDLNQPASQPIQPTVNIPGWTPTADANAGAIPAQGTVGSVGSVAPVSAALTSAHAGAPDFSKILGGNFGG